MLDHRDSTRTQLRTQRNQIYGSSSMIATLPTIANSKMTIDAALLRYYSPSSGDYLHHHQQQLSVPFVAADSTAVVRPRTTTRSSLPSYVIDSRPRATWLLERVVSLVFIIRSRHGFISWPIYYVVGR